jgi:hypothetical protein
VKFEEGWGRECLPKGHNADNEHLRFAVHLEVPDHDRRDWDDDEIHEDTECAGCEDESSRINTFAAFDEIAVGVFGIHGGLVPCILHGCAL